MTKKEQLKVLNDKINANRADFNLNLQTAKISALATDNLDKYEYVTGEETNYRSNPVEQKRFEYSPLGKMFNKGLIGKEDGDDGVLKRLDKIGKTNKELLDGFNNRLAAIEGNDRPAIMGNNGGNNGGNKKRLNQTEQKFKQYLINEKILKRNKEALDLFDSIAEVRKNIKAKSIYLYIKNEKNDLTRLRMTKDIDLYDVVNKYIKRFINENDVKNLLKSAEKAYNKKSKEKSKFASINSILKNTEKFAKALGLFLKLIRKNYIVCPNNNDDTNKNNWLCDVADITWMNDGDLFNEIANDLTSESVNLSYDDELDAIKKFVQDISEEKIKSLKTAAYNFKILKTKVNNKEYINNYMQRLEQALFGDNLENIKQPVFDESIAERVKRKNQGSGLKILTPKQMLSRLPILLAEIQAGNNSKQLKNEVRQLIYSLYTSKQLSKKLYNILIKS